MPASSSSGSSSDGEVTWAEKKVNLNDDWLGTAVGSSASYGRSSLLSKRDAKVADKRKEDEKRAKIYQSRELNPNLKAGGSSDQQNQETDTKPVHAGFANDHGCGWLQKAHDRILQQAREEGKSPDEVAKERWGSFAKLKEMLGEARTKLRESGGSSNQRRPPPRKDYNNSFRDRNEGHERRREDRDYGNTDRRNDDRRNRDDRDRDRNRRDQNRGESSRPEREFRDDKSHRHEGQTRPEREEQPRIEQKEWKKPEFARQKQFTQPSTSRSRFERKEEESDGSSSPEPAKSMPKSSEPEAKFESSQPTVAPLTESEKNSIHAKIMKAEMLGNNELVKQLKDKLDFYSKLPKATASGPPRPTEQEKRATREIQMAPRISEENLTLKQMFMREKNTTSLEDTKMFVSSSARSINPKNADDEYDVEKKAKKRKGDERGEQYFAKQERVVPEECADCMSRIKRHLVMAAGEQVYLHLGKQEPLVPGHTFITSISHSFKSMVSADEDCIAEIASLKSGLCQMYAASKKSLIFFESYRKKSSAHRNHLTVECFPIDSSYLYEAKMYFKKAILECEGEWDMNKKLVELNGRCVSRALPKSLPYFWVTFGPTNEGYAHVIEEEDSFPRYFGHELIGGLLDMDPVKWLKPRNVNFDRQFDEAARLKTDWLNFNPFKKSS